MNIQEWIKRNSVSMLSEFVPASKAHAQCLNYVITLCKGERVVLKTDYHMGYGNCPGDKEKDPYFRKLRVAFECEHGVQSYIACGNAYGGKIKILPEIESVLSCLALDSNALDYADFEDWAKNFGYDSDSRSAEKIYKACLDTGLKMRNAFGNNQMELLQEILREY